nr:hypothetical protein [Tanacetum cinerariifolium]
SDEVTESNAKNLLPIPSECEVTSEDKRDCDVPVSTIDICDNHYDIFSDSKIDDDILVYGDDFEDIEYVEVSISDPEIVNQEEENDVHQEEEEEQKQSMEDMMLELVKICRQKELLCIPDNIDDLIESTLNTKLLSINSQSLEKEQQEIKNVVEQPAERRNHSIQSLQNFRVVHKSSISFRNTSQISS